ncbi:MAG: hypothetical protein R6W31_05835 [Bacteroidales bacterium]
MISEKQKYRILFFVAVTLSLGYTLFAANRYSVATGNWNETATWSATPGGPPGASVPLAGDVVYIGSNHSITVTTAAGCTNIIFTGDGALLTVNLGVALSVSGSVTLDNQSTSSTACTIAGSGTIYCSNVEVGSATNTPSGSNDIYTHTMSSRVAYLNISGNLNINSYYDSFKTACNGVLNLESGTLTVGGQIEGVNQSNQNQSTFSMAAGSGSGTLNLYGANPIILHRIRDVLNLNGNSSTVNYSASGVQTLYNTDYHNITLSGSGAKTFPNPGSTTVYGIFSLEGTATAAGKAPSYGANATIQYMGSVQQTTGIEFPATFSGTGGVIIDNLNGVALNGSKTIVLRLTFVDGVISTGANTLRMGSGGTVSGAGAGNYVLGNFEKGIGTATAAKTFEIGDASGYTPVVLSFTGTSNGTGSILAFTTPGDHPQITSSAFNPDFTVNRYWTLTNNGVTGFTSFDATFYFLSGDADPNTNPNSFVIGNYNPSAWTYPSVGTRSAVSTQAIGLNTFGDFQIGEFSAIYRSATSGLWEESLSWEVFIGAGWSPAPVAPSSGSSAITILNTHTISTSTSFAVDELTIDAGASLALGADIIVTDAAGIDFIVNGTLDCGGSNILSGPGSFELSSGASILLGSSEGITLSVAAGNIQTALRSFNAAANYTFNGSAAQVSGDGLPATLNNLTIDNASGVILTASATINGILTLTNGALATGATTLGFQNSDIPIVRAAGTISTNSSSDLFFGSAGNTGGAAFVIPDGTFTSAPIVNNLTINRINILTLNDQMLSIGGILLCNGPLITAGNLSLLSDVSATALIDGASTGSVTGNVTMQRYLPVGFGYKYFSSPFQGATVSEFGDDLDLTYWFPTVYRYDESRTSSGWVAYNDPAGILEPMNGYSVNFGSGSAPVTVDVSGEVNNGPLSLTLNNNNHTYTQGMNLIGNPYPSAIDWDAASGWTKTNIDNAIYYFNASAADEYSGTYSSYVNGVSSDGVASNVIPSMQGFFIHVSDGSYPVTGTIAMNNSVRITDRTHYFAKSSSSIRERAVPLIRVSVMFTDDSLSIDPFVLYMDEEATSGFDPDLDARKLLNTNFSVPNLYALLQGGEKLSIDGIPIVFEAPVIIPLGVKTNRQGPLSFGRAEIDPSFADFELFFYDARTKVRHKLSDDFEYEVLLDAGEYHDRFFLELQDLTAGVEEAKANEAIFTAFASEGHIKAMIPGFSGSRGVLSIYSMDGRLVSRQEIESPGEYELEAPGQQGIYIVNFISGIRGSSVKLFIGSQ